MEGGYFKQFYETSIIATQSYSQSQVPLGKICSDVLYEAFLGYCIYVAIIEVLQLLLHFGFPFSAIISLGADFLIRGKSSSYIESKKGEERLIFHNTND